MGLIEGTAAELKCTSSDSSTSIKWQKVGDPAFVTNDEKLTVQNIRRSNAGEYRCVVNLSTGKANERIVTVNVLYPPSIPAISGPFKVLKNSNFELACHADANPAASYKWTFEPDTASEVITTDSVVRIENIESNDLYLYCYAENTMLPTDGRPQTTTSHSYRQVITQTNAFIWDLNDQYEFAIGSIVDVKCKADGIPPPIYLWTKESDPDFMRDGERLIEQNVQADFSGVYSCNAENTVKPTDGVAQTIYDVKQTIIRIVDPTIPEVCQNLSCFQKEAKEPGTCSATCGSNTGVVAVAVVGWVIAAIAFLVVVFLCLPCRRKSKGSDSEGVVPNTHTAVTAPAQSTDNTVTTKARPELPVRPVLTKTDSDHTYLELSAGSTRDENRPYDYVKPTEERVRGRFEEQRSSPDGYETPNQPISSGQSARYDQLDDNKTDITSLDADFATVQKSQPGDIKRRDSYEHPDV